MRKLSIFSNSTKVSTLWNTKLPSGEKVFGSDVDAEKKLCSNNIRISCKKKRGKLPNQQIARLREGRWSRCCLSKCSPQFVKHKPSSDRKTFWRDSASTAKVVSNNIRVFCLFLFQFCSFLFLKNACAYQSQGKKKFRKSNFKQVPQSRQKVFCLRYVFENHCFFVCLVNTMHSVRTENPFMEIENGFKIWCLEIILPNPER